MFDIPRARHVRENEDAEGFEDRFDQPEYTDILTNNSRVATYVTKTGARNAEYSQLLYFN